MTNHIPSTLTRGLDEKAKAEFESVYKGANRVLVKIKEECEKKLEQSIKDSEKLENYDSPNNHLLQADRLGYRRGLREFLDLLPK